MGVYKTGHAILSIAFSLKAALLPMQDKEGIQTHHMRVLDTALMHTTDNNSTILVHHDVVEAHATALNQTGMLLSNHVARG